MVRDAARRGVAARASARGGALLSTGRRGSAPADSSRSPTGRYRGGRARSDRRGGRPGTGGCPRVRAAPPPPPALGVATPGAGALAPPVPRARPILIVLNRWFRLRRRARVHPRRLAVEGVMQRWALGQADVRVVLAQLARLPVSLAVEALVSWSARVPGDRWRRLATALEGEWWARMVRTNSRSARWWKRLEAARLLSLAATPADT